MIKGCVRDKVLLVKSGFNMKRAITDRCLHVAVRCRFCCNSIYLSIHLLNKMKSDLSKKLELSNEAWNVNIANRWSRSSHLFKTQHLVYFWFYSKCRIYVKWDHVIKIFNAVLIGLCVYLTAELQFEYSTHQDWIKISKNGGFMPELKWKLYFLLQALSASVYFCVI